MCIFYGRLCAIFILLVIDKKYFRQQQPSKLRILYNQDFTTVCVLLNEAQGKENWKITIKHTTTTTTTVSSTFFNVNGKNQGDIVKFPMCLTHISSCYLLAYVRCSFLANSIILKIAFDNLAYYFIIPLKFLAIKKNS